MPKLAHWPILALTLALAGCGGGGGGGGTPAPTSGTSNTPPSNVVVVAPGAPSGGSTSTSGGGSSSSGGTATGQPQSVSVTGLSYPQGVAVYGSTLYVANTSGASISAIALTPPNYPMVSIQLTYPSGAPPLTQPTGLAVSKDGTTLYVANWSGPVVNSQPGPGFIDAVNIATGAVTPLASGLNNPDGLVLSADGNSLFVANHGNGQILQFSTTGANIATYPTPGTYPYGVYADGANNLYATNQNGTILKWAIPTSGTPGPASTLLTFNNPCGITGSGGYLYVADYLSKTISKVDATSGAILATSSVSPYQPFLLTHDNTYLYFTDGNSGSVNAIPLP